jgi:hypothetical protein
MSEESAFLGLTKAVEAQALRLDQLAKTLEDTQQGLTATVNLLEVTILSLKTALNESDRTTDDLSVIVLALQKEVVKVQSLSDLRR